ncbi:MAG TPA: nuclear transport factor 2 family protein [Candidatus Binatia bacterium]|jgi:uncharacterized protein (TIGR02246 family)
MRKIATTTMGTMGTMGLMAALALAGMLSGCAAQRHGTGAAKVQRPSNPEDVDRLFGERVNAGDLEGVVALYEPTATLVRQDRSSATGTEEIRKDLGQLMALKPQINMNVSRIVTDGGDIAVLHDEWHLTGTGPDGKPLMLSGRASEVVRRQRDGTWRFVVDDPDARRAPACPMMHTMHHPVSHPKEPAHGKRRPAHHPKAK